MKKNVLVLDGRLSSEQWDTLKTIRALHEIPATYCKSTIWFPVGDVNNDFIKTALNDRQLMKNCIAVIIQNNGIEFLYWNK
jgi:hypothetical protein